MSAAIMIMAETEPSPICLAPAQDQQIAWLDAARDCQSRYAALFFACVRSIGVVPYVTYQASGRHLAALFPMEDETKLRSGRMSALVDHARLMGMRQTVMNDVERRGLVCDERRGDPLALRRTIRSFLAIGSNIHIRPDGTLSHSGGMPPGWGTGGALSDWIENSTRCYLAILKLPGAAAHIERAVRMLGKRLSNGFIVLEAATTISGEA